MKIFKNSFVLLSLIIAISCILASCKKKENTPPVNDVPDMSSLHGAFIMNEGNYQAANGSVSFYNTDDGTLTEDLFNKANGRILGDVVQSMCIIDTKAYIVVNNSNKIEIVNLKDFTSTGQIQNLVSPRYILPVSSTKAYVSDLYSNSITVVNLTTNEVSGHIPCKGSTEEMLMTGNSVFVTNTRTEYVYIVNTNTDAITDSIHVGIGSNSMQIDKNGKLWVMCAGDLNTSATAGIYKINIQNLQVEHAFPISATLNIWDKLRMNAAADTIYYLHNGVNKMDVSSSALPSAPFIQLNGRNFHGLAVSAGGTIFIADAIDYVQKGKVYTYNASGILQNTLSAGIIPGDISFK
jgi:YVTN family beta-propeller protein